MNDLLANWADLSPEQRELLLLLLQEEGIDIDEAFILPQERPTGRAPLSFAQQRLWFLDQLEPGSAMYNIPSAVRLSGRLDVAALHRALNEVVRRHEILRTVFGAEGDEPAQIILPELALPLPVIDLRPASIPEPPAKDAALAEALRLAAEEAQRPFDLAAGPLLRATLLRLADDEHVLLFTLHHIIADGWSVGVLINEIGKLYAAFSRGEAASPLPDLPIQYADYAAWQTRWLQGRGDGASPLRKQLNYWRKQLAGSPALLELPTDRPRPPVQTSHGAVQPLVLDQPSSEALKRLGQAEEATPFMTLLAAFLVLLHRYSGQDHIAVGTPVANRTRAELEPLIGFFANTLVIHARFDGVLADSTFRALLRQVRELVIEAQAHQDVQFEMLVEELKPQRDMSYTPLFQAMFSYQQAAVRGVQLPGLTLSPLEAHSGTAKFDLLLNMADTAKGFSGSLEYNTDLFDASTIARMVGHYRTLLEGIVSAPDQPIRALPLLTAAERQTLLSDWNATDADIDTAGSIHDRFSQQAARTPGAIAVLVETADAERPNALTYAELDARSNQLAHHLRSCGVGPEQIVGLLTERSTDTLVGIFGILKAGGAYLPLDPSYPAERLSFMLEDAGVRVLLTQERVLADGRLKIGNLPESAIVCLDADWPAIAQHPTFDIQPATFNHPDTLAYVIYTSGSTGRPKGVMVNHRSALNLAGALQRAAYAYSAPNRPLRLSLNAPLAFDASVQQLVMLTYGHTLVVIPQEIRSDANALLAFIRRHRLDQLDCVPSQLKLLLAAGLLDPDAEWRPSIVFPGGEAIDPATWAALADAPATEFFNMYGPTECTVDATTACVRLTHSRPTIGRPLANTRAYVLDRQMQPVPIGIPGELYIGGAGVTRGYLNRPELTAERFVPDPFALIQDNRLQIKDSRPQGTSSSTCNLQSSHRLYRTGDLVRWLADGNIEFLGRTDFQVKVRGFRIELGEIEAALRRHPNITDAVVLARADQPGETRLVAYVVPVAPPAPAVADLRHHLLADLPEYMVPAAFVALPALPLTPNAKIDRKALPAPDAGAINSGVTFIAPRSPTEEMLAGIYAELLRVERVGTHDDFFDLGGHSLLATQLMSRVRQTFRVELPLRALFEAPTVGGLADQIDRARRSAGGRAQPVIEPVPREQPLLLSFGQQRLWFLNQLDPNSPEYNIPNAIRIRGSLDVSVLERCLNEIVQRHESLRTTFPTVDGRPHQAIAAALTVPLPLIDLSSLGEADRMAAVRAEAAAEARRPFDLAHGPLLRARLLRLAESGDGSPGEYVVLLTMHHIISDGWSAGVFTRELGTLYQAFADGQPSPLPPLAIQYADFAAWQRTWLETGQDGSRSPLQEQLDFWKTQLGDLPPLLELPTDRPRPAVQTVRGGMLTFSLSKELTDELNRLSREQETTLFMTTLAAFQTLLHRLTGQKLFGVGTPIANRNRAEIERLIGFFVNTLVLRADFSGEPSFREVLRRVRETALDAYAHQDLPFEMVVDALHPQRDLGHTPLFQVMFTLQSAAQHPGKAALTLPGLTLSPLEVETGVTPFDITLTLAPPVDSAKGLSGAVEYNADLFDATTIQRMIDRYRLILEAALAHPELPVSELPLLTAPEEQQILRAWNATTTTDPDGLADLCMHQLFEAQAARTPDAVAVIMPGSAGRQTLTYDQLNRRANQLAHHLRQHGVGPETLVGLMVDRSFDLAVGLLGILKTGGAYLPLDPAYPADRLAYMMADAGIRVLVTQARALDDDRLKLADLPPSGIVCLDDDWPAIAGMPTNQPTNQLTNQHLAYVIYTSGSTGKPKGVMVNHRSVVNHNLATAKLFGLTPGDRVLQFATINFDAAIEEIFPTWHAGAALVLRPGEALTAGQELRELIAAEGITVLDLPTAYWHEWVNELELLEQVVPPSVRLVVVGGDKASGDRLAAWQRLGGDRVRWLNTYGPTEGSIIVSAFEAPAGADPWPPERAVPLGRPIDNVRLYVLDRHWRLTPVSVPGELYIGGAAVARGYLGRPELTAERFVPDPFEAVTGPRLQVAADALAQGQPANLQSSTRLYRTGDLVRWLPDGNLEFLGRADSQVKVRGFRVEPGEVEAVLEQHPAVRECVVVAREDGRGHKRLVAYASLQPAAFDGMAQPDAAALRAHLQERLPEYMLPAAFVILDALPRSPAGKVDRRALPAPEFGEPKGEAAGVAPRGPTEALLAGIFAQVLGVTQVGPDDSFFELGGDSILSIQVVARAAQAGLRITPKQIFQTPTVARLAALAEVDDAPILRAEQGPVVGPTPLTPIQHWFFGQALPLRSHWNQSVLLSVRGVRLEPQHLRAAVAALVAHHDALRLRFTEDEAGWQQSNAAPDDAVPFMTIDLAALPDHLASAQVEAQAADVQRSLDLAHGPLVRVVYFDFGSERPGRLLIAAHHLVMDGVSWRIVVEDLQAAYEQHRRTGQVRLPPKTTSFREWAIHLVDQARSKETRSELDYWLAELSAWSPSLPADFDAMPDARTEASSEQVAVTLTAEETRALLQDIPAAYGADINDALLTALVQALERWTGSGAATVYLEGHGREEISADVDVSRTVGWFTAMYPVRLELPFGAGPGQALMAVKEHLRGTPRRGIGFGLLRYLSDDPDVRSALAALPEPELSFNYLGQFDQVLAPDSALGPARETAGPDRSPAGPRSHLLDVAGGIAGGQLSVSWSYSSQTHRRETIARVAADFAEALRALIAHAQSAEAGGYTPSDFPLAQLDQEKLNRILNRTKSKS